MDPFGIDSIRVKERQKLARLLIVNVLRCVAMTTLMKRRQVSQIRAIQAEKRDKMGHRLENLNRMIRETDTICLKELRVNRKTLGILCEMVRDIGGLRGTQNVQLEEIVSMFLFTLAHPKEIRSIVSYFRRREGGESFSRQFNLCLYSVISLYSHLLKEPTPISEDCEDDTWKIFKNCLGALDCTFVKVHVSDDAKGRYYNEKGELTMNVFGVCTPNMEFIYILPGWEGSAEDDRVLRDAISRSDPLTVPQGCYYLVDGEFPNFEGFLAPYKGHPYQVRELGDEQEVSAEVYFNMKHAKVRKVIERCFGQVKKRWAILQNPSLFPIETQGDIVAACALLHNLIRKHMPEDDVSQEETDDEEKESDSDEEESDDMEEEYDEVEYITHDNASDAWSSFRDSLAMASFNKWMSGSNM